MDMLAILVNFLLLVVMALMGFIGMRLFTGQDQLFKILRKIEEELEDRCKAVDTEINKLKVKIARIEK